VIGSILDMNNIIPTVMSFTVSHDTNSSNVVSGSDHGNIANIEFDEAGDFRSLEIQSDGIANLDSWVWVSDCAGIVGDEVRYTSLAELHTFDFAELVL
jgi:hypothetical protein